MCKMTRAWLFLPCALVIAVLTPATVENLTAQNAQTATSTLEAPRLEFFQQYCFQCHGATTQRAGLNLESLATDNPLVRNRDTWEMGLEMLDLGRRPPGEKGKWLLSVILNGIVYINILKKIEIFE